MLVVNGMITNERIRQKVILSYSSTGVNQEFRPAPGATVSVSTGDQIYLFHEDPQQPGTYLTDSIVQGVIGKTYDLYISLNGIAYSAEASMVPVEPLPPLRYTPCGDGYQFVFSDSGDPSMTEINLDWTGTASCTNVDSCHARLFYYVLNNIDVNEIFPPDQEKVCFPHGTMVIRRKYSLTPDYQEFLRTLLSETTWHGGLFDVESGNVNTNLSKGAVGYFSACTVVSDTITVN